VALPDPVLAAYTPAQIDFARAAWPLRAAEELRSALVYRTLARACADARWESAWTAAIDSVAIDEMSHVRLCRVVGARLGAAVPIYDREPVRARVAGFSDQRDVVAGLMLVEVAAGETISASLFRAGHRATVEPLAQAALRIILADEERHANFGWQALSALWPTLTEQQRCGLQEEAARGLAGLEQTMVAPALRWMEDGLTFDPALAELGVLPPEARVEAFYTTVEEQVLPGLTALGLDGRAAWSRRYRRA
jgi:hypothetical protein